ncbi:spondin domain-containing protein [Aurantivibrio plasticivorans]
MKIFSSKSLLAAGLVLCGAFSGVPALADKTLRYEVEITNVTKGQFFTPQLVATHNNSVSVFELGQPASIEVELLAEGGDTAPLTDLLLSQGSAVSNVVTIPGLIGPGETHQVVIEASRHHRYLSVAAMLIPTNDTFLAVNGVRLPFRGTSVTHSPGYDAGTELNDQNCANIPGPRCGGDGYSPGPNDGDEGFVYIGNGFHDLGTEDEQGNEILTPEIYDWNNSVAVIKVTRIH